MKEPFNPSEDIHPVYQAVLGDFLKSDVSPVLIGGAAVVLYGSRRLTGDIDIAYPDMAGSLGILYANDFQVVYKRASDPITKEEIFETVQTEEDAVEFLMENKRKAFKTIHVKSGVELDVWLNLGISYQDILSDSRTMSLGGINIPVASVRHLIEMKRQAIKENPERDSTDGPDIEFLERVEEQERKKIIQPKKPPYPDPDHFP